MTTTILKKILAAASIILIPAIAVSQETADTIPVHELNEVIVRAPQPDAVQDQGPGQGDGGSGAGDQGL